MPTDRRPTPMRFARLRPALLAAVLAVVALSLTAAGVVARDGSDAADDERRAAAATGALERDSARQIVDEARDAALQRELERVDRRRSPEWRKRRARSRTAFEDLGSGDAVALAQQSFPGQLRGKTWLGLHLRDGERVRRYLGDHAAVVEHAGGKRSIAESAVPLRASDDEGGLAPVDLTLTERGGRLEPVNPIVPIGLSKQAGGAATLERSGVTVRLAGAEGTAARVQDDRLVAPEALPDTDAWIAPRPEGFQTFATLRSAESPEELAYELELPAGAELRQLPDGTAEVARGDRQLVSISAPVASDADGQPVGVTTKLDGTRLVLRVDHRGEDLRYPLLVDPIFESTTEPIFSLYEGWDRFSSSSGLFDSALLDLSHRWNLGLYVFTRSGAYVPAGQWAGFYFDPPGTTTHTSYAGFVSSHAAISSCLERGISNTVAQGECHSTDYHFSELCSAAGCPPHGGVPGSFPYVALSSSVTATRTEQTKAIAALIDAGVQYSDNDLPAMGNLTLTAPGAWGQSWSGAIGGTIDDSGVGLQRHRLSVAGTSLVVEDIVTYDLDEEDEALCGPVAIPCPSSMPLGYSLSSAMPELQSEGRFPIVAEAWDAVGNHASRELGSIRVDRTGPTIALGGALWSSRVEGGSEPTLAPGSHALTVAANDGGHIAGPADERSGARSIEVRVDGETVLPANDVPCPSSSCGITRDWSLATGQFPAGRRTVTVVAKDHAGNQSSSSFDVKVPPAGELTWPGPRAATSRWLPLQAEAHTTGYSTVRFQYRMPLGGWTDIPASALVDQDGQPVAGPDHALSGSLSPKLGWDLTRIPALVQDATAKQIAVRAVFAGGHGGTSKTIDVTYDARGLSTDDAHAELGPGSVNLVTGNLVVSRTDAGVTSWGAPVAVARTLNSRDPGAGPDGPFGPGWTVGAAVQGSSEYVSLEEQVDPFYGFTTVTLTTIGGAKLRYWNFGGPVYVAEDAGRDTELTKPASDRFELATDGGDRVTFRRQAGTTAATYVPTAIKQPGGANTSTVEYEVVAGKQRLLRLIAPSQPPYGVNCAVDANARGCRSLTLAYAGATTATGSDESGWGDYAGRVTRIDMRAWDPATSAMSVDVVARYLYDSSGRLRAQWDPRVTPTLKERYAYDVAGRLTQVDPAAGPPTDLAYAALPGDFDGGRLLSASVATPQGTATSSLVYDLPVSGPSAPNQLGRVDVAAWGQNDFAASATAVLPPDGGSPSAPDYSRATVHYLNRSGLAVNVVGRGGSVTTAEYDRYGNVIRELSPGNRLRALAAGGLSADVAARLDVQRTYDVEEGLELRKQVGPQREIELANGDVVQARTQTEISYDEGAPVGKDPHLPTTETVSADLGGTTADQRVTKTEYDWTLLRPTKTIADPAGLALERRVDYDAVTGQQTMETPPKAGAPGRFTIYYTSGYDYDEQGCGNRPEWVGLPCLTKRSESSSAEPVEGSTVKRFTYNRLNQVVTEIREAGGTEIWTDNTYDVAGRPLTSKTSAPDATAGLVAAFGFEESSGTSVSDASGKGNAGTIENGATRTDDGRYGRALRLDGTDDRVRVADSASLDLGSAMTLQAWVRPDALAGETRNVIGRGGAVGGCAAPTYALQAYVSTSAIAPRAAWCNAWTAAPAASSLRQGVWSHLAVIRDGAMQRLYLNGEQIAEGTVAGGAVDAVGDLLIGDGPGGQFAGLVDEVRIYERALPLTELRSDMRRPVEPTAAGTPALRAGLLGAYGFEERGPSPTIKDSSPHGDHGEVTYGDRTMSGRHGRGLHRPIAQIYDEDDSQAVTSQFTVSAWVAAKNSSSSDWGVVAERFGAFSLAVNSTGVASFSVDTGGATAVAIGLIPINTAVHLAGTYDGSMVRIYVNGVQGYSAMQTGDVTTQFGGMSIDMGSADRVVDDLRLYGSVLSPAQIVEDAAQPVGDLERVAESPGGTLPKVTTGYDPETGRPTTLSTTEDGVTRTVTRGYDSMGRVTSYTDADGNTSTTSYDLLGRPTEVDDGKGTQTFGYDSTTGLLTELEDSHAGTFTANYDVEGKLLSQTYPNGLTADTLYDETGDATDLTYTKQDCSTNCVWFEEHQRSTVHGQVRARDSSLSDQRYDYDQLGRLTEVRDTQTGGECVRRAYGYDEHSNRTSRTDYLPGPGAICGLPSGASTESSSYDALDRLVAPGVQHDPFGRMSTVPASHSGGADLNTTYYANDLVRTQTQGSVSKGWLLDPTQTRARATIPSGTVQEVMHYSDDSDSPAWTAVLDGGVEQSWERTVTGIDGGLAAVVSDDGEDTTVELQLANLHGDITATASTDEEATAPTATFESDEFGNPRQGDAKKYGWLGGKERRSVLPSGVIQMGVRSYVPAMGRFTSVDPVVGGSHNDYEYAGQDPVNSYDLDGRAKVGRCDIRHNWTRPKFGLPPKPGRVTAYIDKACTREIAGRMEAAGAGSVDVAGAICGRLVGLIPGPGGALIAGGCAAVVMGYWYDMKFQAQYASITNRCLTLTIPLALPVLPRKDYVPHWGASKNKPWCRAKKR